MEKLCDRITRLRNTSSKGLSSFERKFHVSVNSEAPDFFIFQILNLLKREGYIRFFTFRTVGRCVYVTVHLKYNAQGVPAFRSIFPISTPGRIVHFTSTSLWQPLSSTGLFIVSTSQGLCTDREARLHSLGGQLLFGVFLNFLTYI